MSIDERSRHELHQRLEQVLGQAEAATLMAHLPPVGWADVATKHDLADLEARVDLRFDQVDRRFVEVDRRFDQVDGRFDQVMAELDRRFTFLMTELQVRDEAMVARIGESEQRVLAVTRADIIAAVTTQTRVIVLTMLAAVITLSAVAVAAAAA